MTRFGTTILALLAFGWQVVPAPLGAAPASDAAARFASASKILAAEVEAAGAAWIEQHELYGELMAAAQRLERLYTDSGATAAQLRAVEDEYEAALDAVVGQARKTIARRRAVYDAMERVEKLGREVEQAAERDAGGAAEPTGVFGTWLLDLDLGGGDLVGLMTLGGDGTLVTGSYRLSNGRNGSLTGTFAGDRLELTRVDSQTGRDATLEAILDEERGELAGSWQKFELASGEPAAGRWSASRVAPGDELPDLGGD